MIIQRLKPPLRVLRRALGLTPMGYVLSQLTSRGVPLARLDALKAHLETPHMKAAGAKMKDMRASVELRLTESLF